METYLININTEIYYKINKQLIQYVYTFEYSIYYQSPLGFDITMNYIYNTYIVGYLLNLPDNVFI